MIREGDRVTRNGRGDGEGRFVRQGREVILGEICCKRLLDARIIVAGKDAHPLDAVAIADQGEAGVGGADIADEPPRGW